MNQTKKRLAIIKLAVSMTDTETIQLQVLKLGMLKTDSKLREILSVLSEHNYAQAQILISNYIDTDTETTVLQRSSSQKENISNNKLNLNPKKNMKNLMEESREEAMAMIESKGEETPPKDDKDKAIIEQFELFSDISQEETPEEIDNYSTYLNTTLDPKKMSTPVVNYDSLLNVDASDILSDNINLDISKEQKENFLKKEELHDIHTTQKDDFFNIDENRKENMASLVEEHIESFTEIPNTKNENTSDKSIKKIQEEMIEKEIVLHQEDESKEESLIIEEQKVDTYFNAIPYIDQKLKNMQIQYPPVHESDKSFTSVDEWLLKISNKGYSELEVEEMIKQIENLSNTNKDEAAKLLLISAATKSRFAQFILGRALYKGVLIQKNLPEAFTLINRLAVHDDYPEAICDLAQFYENGIGITKDKKKAELLYKEAMDLGIHRATNHYERIRKDNKGFFSFMK